MAGKRAGAKVGVGFIGGGNMAGALIHGLLQAGLYTPEQIVASDVDAKRLAELKRRYGIGVTDDNLALTRAAKVIVLAVKPQILDAVLDQLRPEVTARQLFLSIAAGATTKRIEKRLGGAARVLRSMPNTPALLGKGMSVLVRGKHATAADEKLGLKLLRAVGDAIAVPKESLLDPVTGLSGSGPAYIYMVIEALTDGGVMMGLPRNIATRLATQTVLGSAKLVRETNVHPAMLKDQVTTPGGTTILAIKELEESGLRPMLIRAVETATNRSRELSYMLEKKNNVD